MNPVKIALIGAGQRGHVYTKYALTHPQEAKVVAVAEADPARRREFRDLHGIEDGNTFADWRDMLAAPKTADAILICLQDRMHYEPTIQALEAGYHVLLEKPMSTDPLECLLMGAKAAEIGTHFDICHVLRYSPFFATLKKLLAKGTIGRLMSIQHNENVAYWHQAHSYVRGNWRRSDESSPMILAKSCHDMDILLWLAGADCVRVSSFGSLSHFRSDNAPEGAPLRCLDGCPAQNACLYYAPNTYLTDNTDWPTSVISNDMSYKARAAALMTGPYGRCVYHCDNDVVDHQVVNLEFANEVTAAFTMSAFTNENHRTIKLMGTRGEIRGAMDKNEIEIIRFGRSENELITLEGIDGHIGHGGGDSLMIANFISSISDGSGERRTSAQASVQSHLMAFAAEQSRLTHQVIDMNRYTNELTLLGRDSR
ncbi:Gfo/Idh/MocA family protein [Cohnella nanjingensis]|uniref:Gfo/Idh/MocA family oxidoreductase n=1 Tax=Cohnella nanjingensis TaxID=1387779 RepID=A0A7X0VHV4_9BACL|nr:Gfo/Idh/MocA family oxidoreductase [Cohnella nanjingensis]MBB6674530.1 Gfo/Idh/MocA family oxidoreductase [Cohnella nanjingensis]